MYLSDHKFNDFHTIKSIYPCYYGVTKMEYDIDSLIQTIYQIKKEVKKGWEKSNTTNAYKSIPIPLIGNFKKFNTRLLEFLSTSVSKKISNISFWANINSQGGSDRVHHHNANFTPSEKLLSGVYYLKTPLDSGDICFLNQSVPHEHFHLTPKEKDLVIFPSYLLHYVTPNLSQEDRISIAFNFEIE